MKKYWIILITTLCSFSQINDPIDKLGIKGPLAFNKTVFNLVWADEPHKAYYIQEYVPAGETVQNFNQMLTMHLFVTDVDVAKAVQQKVDELNKRKTIDPTCNYQVNESPNAKEVIVDFLLGESKDDEMTIAEFNIYRYKQIDIGSNKKAILVYTYSKRAYGNSITKFYKNLGKDRTNMINEMIGSEMPAISIAIK